MKIIIGILMLCIIVIAHELGHLWAAKANHIEVKEFWIGFGPEIFSFEKGGTKYALRIIPLGGACVFEDERLEEELAKEEPTGETKNVQEVVAAKPPAQKHERKYDKHGRMLLYLNEASVGARIITLIAGPVMNFVLAFLMGLVVMGFSYIPGTTVSEVSEGGPAYNAGLQAGDEIVKINGSRVYLYPEVSLAIQTGVGKPLELVYERNGERFEARLIPEMNEQYGYYMIGVGFGSEEDYSNSGIISTITGSCKYVRYMIKMTYLSLKMLLNGSASVKDMSGPVGVVSIVSSEYDAAAKISPMAVLVSMMNIAVLISANLGVLNLLPVPALDGGRLIFAIYELITRKKVDAKVEGVVNFIGSALLVLLMVIVLFNDVLKLFGM